MLSGKDELRAVLIAAVSLLLLKIDTSHTYHSVRNQAMLKLYVIFNLLEVFDKLCASFGQDILESLFESAQRPRRWRGGLAFDFLISMVYIVLHTMVLFYHAVALNIALNSHNNILITLLISNNFVELKGNVFKKCERENLFQVACSDIVERFQVSVYVSIVLAQFIFVQKVDWTVSDLSDLGARPLRTLPPSCPPCTAHEARHMRHGARGTAYEARRTTDSAR